MTTTYQQLYQWFYSWVAILARLSSNFLNEIKLPGFKQPFARNSSPARQFFSRPACFDMADNR